MLRRLFERQQFSVDEAFATLATCREMEAARDDLKTLFENQTATLHAMKPASRRYASNTYKSNTGMKLSAENCSKCGDQHPPRKSVSSTNRLITMQNVATAKRCR